ncbi:MAG: hypothetical protein AMXMBFR84_15550 [Candidatus Hydrogenedentota bacterium]
MTLDHTRNIRSEMDIESPGTLVQNPEILLSIFESAPDAILLVDHSGRIVLSNAQSGKMFGYGNDELVGQLVEVLVPTRLASKHVGVRSGYISAPKTRPMGAGLELFGRRKDGTEFPVDIMLSPLNLTTGGLVLGVIRDATERKRVEAQALQAREMYLKEVHHRVKNNLQVISSLLFLQSTYLTDPDVAELLQESQNRVKSIALIHEKFYRSPEFTRIDFSEYVRDLVADLLRTYAIQQGKLSVELTIVDASLDIDTAIPCGLVINELVANVIKHAFPEGTSGRMWISLERKGDQQYELTVRDNGRGLPPELNWRDSNSLGLKLVADLTQQLEGTMDVVVQEGTTFRIGFREPHYKERS